MVYLLRMAHIKNLKKNAFIVEMRDKKNMSFDEMAKIFNVSKRSVFEIYYREKGMLDEKTGRRKR